MNEQGYVCVFAKTTHAEPVKTRLAPVAGYGGAAVLAEAFLQDTWSVVCSLPWAKPVIASTDHCIASVVSGNPEIWLQGEGDLGARLERILSCALKSSPFAIAIGGDTPGLPLDLFEQARTALHVADAVIGPSEDGGFYLLGMRRCPEGLLSEICWSQGCTCQQTVAKLKAAGLTVELLPPWFDVDRPADLARLQAMIADGKIHSPRTQDAILRLQCGKAANRALKISVIIPALNERAYLSQTIAHLRQRRWVHELIVVDGGSKDGTREWLAHQTDLKFIESLPGRGRQLNAGARVATGDALVFLHADCVPPVDAGELLIGAFSSGNVAGGCFPVTFDRRRPISLQLVAAGINLRARLTHGATGDQAIFVRREVFERIGRFRDWPLFEDVDLVTRMKQAGRFVVVSSPVTVSARRHVQYGVFRTVALVYLLRLGFWAGISPFKLAGWYKAPHPNLKRPPELGVMSELDVVPD